MGRIMVQSFAEVLPAWGLRDCASEVLLLDVDGAVWDSSVSTRGWVVSVEVLFCS